VLDLSPIKILVVLIVGLLVLGPDKLPQLARQMGAAWGDFRRWRARMESDVRDGLPDLPPTHKITEAVRSPLSFLDRLADEHEQEQERERERRHRDRQGDGSVEGVAVEDTPSGDGDSRPSGAGDSWPSRGVAARPDVRPAPGPLPLPPDDPSMN
jgi:TatA/E family protein of Tat protein translocase